jgi:hypothetical protein
VSKLASVVIHCTDPYVAGPFWSLALGLPPIEGDAVALRDRTLAADESVLLRDPIGKRPDVWISPHPRAAKRDPGLVHLDIQLDDLAELDRLVEAGAVVRWEVEEPHRWSVLEAPDGVLFCAIHPA